MCAVCGTALIVFGGMFVCCLSGSLVWVWKNEFVLFGTACSRFGGVSVCCLWDSLVWVWWDECVLSVGLFGMGLG